jgi:hypothetical protein
MFLVFQYLPPRVLIFSAEKRRQCLLFVFVFACLAAVSPRLGPCARCRPKTHDAPEAVGVTTRMPLKQFLANQGLRPLAVFDPDVLI